MHSGIFWGLLVGIPCFVTALRELHRTKNLLWASMVFWGPFGGMGVFLYALGALE